ncbi:MAG: hypothetical protein SOX88_01775 [Treponema sp.]|nr:hypothetical protein [Treponema sp.]
MAKKKPASQKTPASMICSAADAVGYEIDLPCIKTMLAPAICTAADAVGYEIDLSCGESRRDMMFYAAANGVAHGKKIAGIPKDTGIYDLYRSGCCRTRN